MQISLEWLNDYIKLDNKVNELSDLLTFSGIEVENHSLYGEIPDTVIIAKVIDCQKTENSEHLQICQIDTGNDLIHLVCGAPNCRKGLMVALALSGTKLGAIEIRRANIRGYESNGMLCSEKELGLSDNHDGILELPVDAPLGMTLIQYLHLPDDIFELEITPNRPDLLGYQGIAADLAASLEQNPVISSVDISEENTDNNSISDNLSLDIKEPESCQRYVARLIKNVKIGQSPVWLKLRLLKSGLRPINNVVDVTNYVMLETGHPLHAFDYDKLAKNQDKAVIVVRRAVADEQFSALDGLTYSLHEENLVIADAEKAIALAGVIGGANSHISDSTVNIVIEAACFNHSSVRRTSYIHKISTDSSYRFERQLAPETCEYASIRATQLILELAGGLLAQGKLDEWKQPRENLIIPIRPSRIKQVIGISIDKERIIHCLSNLGLIYHGEGCYKKFYPTSADTIPRVVQTEDKTLYFNIRQSKHDPISQIEPIEEALFFEIPPKRIDLTREIDLVEEVIRIHGMDNIEQKTKPSSIMDRHAFRLKRKLSDFLVYKGFQEVVNLSFTDPTQLDIICPQDWKGYKEPISLLNPQNINLSVMRTTLIPQLLNTAEYNLNHGVRQLRLFELNKIFLENNSLPKQEKMRLSLLISGSASDINWKLKPREYTYYDVKGIVHDLMKLLGIEEFRFCDINSYFLSENESGGIVVKDIVLAEFGKLSPKIASRFGIDVVELKQDFWVADIDMSSVIDITRFHELQYKSVPRYPATERDLSFIIRYGVSHADIFELIRNTVGSEFFELVLIDEYRGKQIPEGFRSLTYRLILNHSEKTLTDEEVDAIIVLIINKLKSQWDIRLR